MHRRLISTVILLLYFVKTRAQFVDEQMSTVMIDDKTMSGNTNLPLVSTVDRTNSREKYFSTLPMLTDRYSTMNDDVLTSSLLPVEFDDEEQEIQAKWVNDYRTSPKTSLSWVDLSRNNSSKQRSNTKTYLLQGQSTCLRQMCSATLKYDGYFPAGRTGCLRFLLDVEGEPVGQLWIEEDRQSENSSQKILLINKTLKIEHSLHSRMKTISIEARVLFRNSTTDRIVLSEVSLNWNGSCPTHRSKSRTTTRSTLTDTRTSEDDSISSTMEIETTEPMNTDHDQQTRRPNSAGQRINKLVRFPIDQSNFSWVMSIISICCSLIISLPCFYGAWLIRRDRHSSWRIPVASRIELIARHSLRSSNRSNKNIATIAEIIFELMQTDLQQNESRSVDQCSNNSQTSIMSFYTYL